MFELIDHFLISRRVPDDDWTLVGRRIDGNPDARVIYFLPWNTPYLVARHAGFLPLPFLAAYEMPPAIVSSEPSASVAVMQRMVDDAASLVAARRLAGRDVLIVGLSVGTYPATYLANALGARLCSVASADRGDLMIWQSPAAIRVKERAMAKGYRLVDFARTLRGYNPVDNMRGLSRSSTFVVGMRDSLVPVPRTKRLIEYGRFALNSARFMILDAGHVRTLRLSAAVQRSMHASLTGVPLARTGMVPAKAVL
jgi:hypothetical protein